MPGARIGSNCIIAAGAVVTHDVPDGTVWAGVPARQIETIEQYLKKNKSFFLHTKSMISDEKRISAIRSIGEV